MKSVVLGWKHESYYFFSMNFKFCRLKEEKRGEERITKKSRGEKSKTGERRGRNLPEKTDITCPAAKN